MASRGWACELRFAPGLRHGLSKNLRRHQGRAARRQGDLAGARALRRTLFRGIDLRLLSRRESTQLGSLHESNADRDPQYGWYRWHRASHQLTRLQLQRDPQHAEGRGGRGQPLLQFLRLQRLGRPGYSSGSVPSTSVCHGGQRDLLLVGRPSRTPRRPLRSGLDAGDLRGDRSLQPASRCERKARVPRDQYVPLVRLLRRLEH